ncbi:hypothetical protein GEMRC1_001293 [Eukaryota sp. GEM-RC1]
MSNSWVLKCLTSSITNEVFEQDYHDLSQIFEKIVVNDQNINEIYTGLLPLFDRDYLHQFMFNWSMKVFQGVQNVRNIPNEWFLWCLSQSCLNHKRSNISNDDFLVQNFSLIIEASDLLKIFNHPYLNPEIFKNLKNSLPPSYDLFLITCFVKTWKETELWTVKNFEDEILIVDFQSSADNIQILNILSKLTTDSRISHLLNASLLNQSLSTLNQHDQELKEVKQQVVVLKTELHEIKQKEVVLSKELNDQELFFKNELRSLRESVTPLIRIHEDNERKNRIETLNKAKAEENERRRIETLNKAKAEENERRRIATLNKAKAEENERRRIETLNKAKAEENDKITIGALNKTKAVRNTRRPFFPSIYSKNLFNSNNCGSDLSLSNYNTVVKRNNMSGNINSFVEVNLADSYSVKFTRLDDLHQDDDVKDLYDGDEHQFDFIGWTNRNSPQMDGSSTYIRTTGKSHCGSFSPSNSRFPTITKGESITVSFSHGKACFKPSTCTTTFNVDIPSNLVFGMLVWGRNHEWKVERV